MVNIQSILPEYDPLPERNCRGEILLLAVAFVLALLAKLLL